LAALLVAAVAPTAGASEHVPSSWAPAGLLMVRGMPPCLMEDFATARDRCLPPPVSKDDAGEARIGRILDRAVVLIYLMKDEEAAQELEAGIAAFPASLELRHLAARLAISTFKRSYQDSAMLAARTHVDAAILLAPDNADVRTTEAYIMSVKGQIEDAITAYGVAIALQPNHVVALGQRAFLQATKQRYALALKDYGTAIAAAPDDRILRYGRARLMMELGCLRDVLVDLNYLIERYPQESFELYMMRAGVHQALGNSEDALEDLTTLLYGPKGGAPFAIGGDHLVNTLMQRAMVLGDLDRHEEAAKDVVRAIGLGGKQNILRLQVYLRQNGYLTVPVNGLTSSELDAAIQSCFRAAVCRRGIRGPG
jgi:tetratricopeptide (TPR) repeat protein